MKGRWLPFLATTAALALAVVAPAQDRGRRSGGGGGGSERSAPPSRSSERSSPPARSESRSSERSSPPARSESRDRGDQRSSDRTPPPTRSESRGSDTRSSDRGSSNDQSRSRDRSGDQRTPPTQSGGPGVQDRSRDRGSSNDQSRTRDRSSDQRRDPVQNSGPGVQDRRGSDRGGNDRGGSSNGGGSSERRNPFDRETGRGRTDRGSSNSDSRGSGNNGRDDRRSGGGSYGANGSLDRPLRNRPSHSGTVNYGTVHNGYGNARPSRYSGAPGRVSLGDQIRRTRPRSGYNVAFGGTFGGLRVGYVGYSGYWRDDFFCYPFYVFDPWAPNVYCVASPWYRYSYLPGYVNTNRVIVVNNYVSTWGTDGWNSYDYSRPDRNNELLNDSLDDLRDAFERNNTRLGERLVPVTGQVAIYNDGHYDYSISADDFQDMFLDGIDQSKTIRYEITEVRTRGDEVHIRARHEYEDSWGASQVVYHTMTLRRERGDGYVIREFGTE